MSIDTVQYFPRNLPRPLTKVLLSQLPLDIQQECLQILSIKRKSIRGLNEPFANIEEIYELSHKLSSLDNPKQFEAIFTRLEEILFWIISHFGYKSLQTDLHRLEEVTKQAMLAEVIRAVQTRNIQSAIETLKCMQTHTIRLHPVLCPEALGYELYRIRDLVDLLQTLES